MYLVQYWYGQTWTSIFPLSRSYNKFCFNEKIPFCDVREKSWLFRELLKSCIQIVDGIFAIGAEALMISCMKSVRWNITLGRSYVDIQFVSFGSFRSKKCRSHEQWD